MAVLGEFSIVAVIVTGETRRSQLLQMVSQATISLGLNQQSPTLDIGGKLVRPHVTPWWGHSGRLGNKPAGRQQECSNPRKKPQLIDKLYTGFPLVYVHKIRTPVAP
jgi:hypothetical protein